MGQYAAIFTHLLYIWKQWVSFWRSRDVTWEHKFNNSTIIIVLLCTQVFNCIDMFGSYYQTWFFAENPDKASLNGFKFYLWQRTKISITADSDTLLATFIIFENTLVAIHMFAGSLTTADTYIWPALCYCCELSWWVSGLKYNYYCGVNFVNSCLNVHYSTYYSILFMWLICCFCCCLFIVPNYSLMRLYIWMLVFCLSLFHEVMFPFVSLFFLLSLTFIFFCVWRAMRKNVLCKLMFYPQ